MGWSKRAGNRVGLGVHAGWWVWASLHLPKTSLTKGSIDNILVIPVVLKGVPTEQRFYAKAIDRAVDSHQKEQSKAIAQWENLILSNLEIFPI